MKTRILVACIGVPFLLAVIFFLPPWCFAALTAVMSATGCYELMRAVRPQLPKGLFWLTSAGAAASCIGICYTRGGWLTGVSAFVLLTVFSAAAVREYGRGDRIGCAGIAAALCGGVAIPCCLAAMAGLRLADNGRVFALLPLAAAFISDSGAYFAGRAWGKRQAFPHVSPHKTVEGCVGGFVSGVIGMLLFGLAVDLLTPLPVSYPALLLYGAAGNLAAQLGDLTFSLVKRACGIKDFGHILPGHGGILDRFDSMVFVAPVLYAAVRIFPAI